MNDFNTAARMLKLSVAPMEGITTFPMRLWLHLTCAPVSMTTPFLRATQVFPGASLPPTFAPELFQLRGVLPYDLTPQILAAEPDNFLRAADFFPAPVSSIVELNCGCPSPNSAGKNAGSGILRDPEMFGRTLERLSSALGPGRLAVKMRVGFSDPEEFKALLPQVLAPPLARLTVHGRTRAEGYRGHSRWALIETAAREFCGPTWASGDIVGNASLRRLVATAPSVAGAMIGRGILYNPWVFSELRRGEPVVLDPKTLLNALVVYTALNDLWLAAPEKLIAWITKGKFLSTCGTSAAAWEDAAATVTDAAFGVPFVPSSTGILAHVNSSPTAYSRLRYLWQHLKENLPEPLRQSKIGRAKSLRQFVDEYRHVITAAPDLMHLQPAESLQ